MCSPRALNARTNWSSSCEEEKCQPDSLSLKQLFLLPLAGVLVCSLYLTMFHEEWLDTAPVTFGLLRALLGLES